MDLANDTADFGVAISFSAQPSDMVSFIDVNGTRLTSSAGGQDDSSGGALLTVGGIGDTNDNPPPLAEPVGFGLDDELYSLLPFLGPNDTSIQIDTINPSDDDNIFAGHMVFSGLVIEGEGILLAPRQASNLIGSKMVKDPFQYTTHSPKPSAGQSQKLMRSLENDDPDQG